MSETAALIAELESAIRTAKADIATVGSPRDQPSAPQMQELQLIPGVLHQVFTPGRCPDDSKSRMFYQVPRSLEYTPFFADFGPVNTGKVIRFVQKTDEAVRRAARANKVAVYCSPDSPQERANAAFLAGSYLVLRGGRTAEEAFAPFIGIHPPLSPFRDAAFGLCTFTLSVLDCLRGLRAALERGFISLKTFSLEKYEHDENLGNGDINWIVPGLFVAFSGPLDNPKRLADGRTTWRPEEYARYFRSNGVTDVVRLNKTCYDREKFVARGIRHHELFYPDGGLPPSDILATFFRAAESARGSVGVHCKAGLGRTGTCVGAFLMQHYRMTARECVAWMRICRPGSVLGPQQQYLESIQRDMWARGESRGFHTAKLGEHLGRRARPPPADELSCWDVLARAQEAVGLGGGAPSPGMSPLPPPSMGGVPGSADAFAGGRGSPALHRLVLGRGASDEEKGGPYGRGSRAASVEGSSRSTSDESAATLRIVSVPVPLPAAETVLPGSTRDRAHELSGIRTNMRALASAFTEDAAKAGGFRLQQAPRGGRGAGAGAGPEGGEHAPGTPMRGAGTQAALPGSSGGTPSRLRGHSSSGLSVISGERIDGGGGGGALRSRHTSREEGGSSGVSTPRSHASMDSHALSLSRLRRRVTSQDDGMQLGAGTPSAVATGKVRAGEGDAAAYPPRGSSEEGGPDDGAEPGQGEGEGPVRMGGAGLPASGSGAARPTPNPHGST